MGKGLKAILGGVTVLIAVILVVMGIIGIFTGSFPYESWDEGLESAGYEWNPDDEAYQVSDPEVGPLSAGYFTFGPGGNATTVLITWLAIVLSVTAAVMVTKREDDLLNEAAERLADKYDSNG